MILSFRCKDTKKLWQGYRFPKWATIERTAYRKLAQLELAMRLEDMAAPPTNDLKPERLKRQEYWSVRIDDHYRLRFKWIDVGAEDVEIVGESSGTQRYRKDA